MPGPHLIKVGRPDGADGSVPGQYQHQPGTTGGVDVSAAADAAADAAVLCLVPRPRRLREPWVAAVRVAVS